MLFLAKITYIKSYYQNDYVDKIEELRLVEADSNHIANEKIEKYFEDLNVQFTYAVSYFINEIIITEMIT